MCHNNYTYMLSLRKRILLLIGSVLFIILLILLWVFFRKKAPTVAPVETIPETAEVEIDPITTVEYKRPDTIPTQPTAVSVHPDETYAKQTARIFVERFWSYSNQNSNQHIDDALELSVDSMHTWIISQAQEQGMQYAGATTEVLSSRILSLDALNASVEVGARQVVQSLDREGAIVEEIKNITAKVDLVKTGDTWLVSGLWLTP